MFIFCCSGCMLGCPSILFTSAEPSSAFTAAASSAAARTVTPTTTAQVTSRFTAPVVAPLRSPPIVAPWVEMALDLCQRARFGLVGASSPLSLWVAAHGVVVRGSHDVIDVAPLKRLPGVATAKVVAMRLAVVPSYVRLHS